MAESVLFHSIIGQSLAKIEENTDKSERKKDTAPAGRAFIDKMRRKFTQLGPDQSVEHRSAVVAATGTLNKNV